jgi:CAAX protease family protein
MLPSESTWDPADAPEPDSEPLAESTREEESPASGEAISAVRPWGPWATMGWLILCIVVIFVMQMLVFLIFLAVRFASNPHVNLNDLVYDGNLLAVSSLVSTPAVVGLIAFLISVRRYPFRSYLAWVWPPARPVFLAIAGQLLLIGASDLTSYATGRPITPPSVVDVYRSGWLPLLLMALLVAAPVGEEILFRGFVFKGIAESRLGPIGAIAISSIAWALLHIQYDWYGIVTIILGGFYLGWVRYRTRSVPLTIALHCLANAVATLEVIVQQSGLI